MISEIINIWIDLSVNLPVYLMGGAFLESTFYDYLLILSFHICKIYIYYLKIYHYFYLYRVFGLPPLEEHMITSVHPLTLNSLIILVLDLPSQ